MLENARNRAKMGENVIGHLTMVLKVNLNEFARNFGIMPNSPSLLHKKRFSTISQKKQFSGGN